MLIKVPATRAGVVAIEELTALGVNVNVTLLFAVERYEEVIEAYLRGLERRAVAGLPVRGVASVASFFVSRIDAQADAVLGAGSPLRGQVAIANAQHAYARYLARFSGRRWEALLGAGASPQRPLWASTGTKDPSYSDVLYVERLIAAGVINTMPENTLRAFADHGNVALTLGDIDAARSVLSAAAAEGVDLDAITSRARATRRAGLLRLLCRAAQLHRRQARLHHDGRLTQPSRRSSASTTALLCSRSRAAYTSVTAVCSARRRSPARRSDWAVSSAR